MTRIKLETENFVFYTTAAQEMSESKKYIQLGALELYHVEFRSFPTSTLCFEIKTLPHLTVRKLIGSSTSYEQLLQGSNLGELIEGQKRWEQIDRLSAKISRCKFLYKLYPYPSENNIFYLIST